jgi:hypothetical protein
MSTTRAFRIVTDPKAQKAETYRYWQSRSIAERFAAIVQATADAYAMAGKSFDAARRSERTFTRIQR